MIYRRLLILALLMAGTVGFFNLYPRYEPVGPELLVDPHFTQGFSHWSFSGRGMAEVTGDGSVILRSPERSADVAVRQSLLNPWRYPLLRLSAELSPEDIHAGRRFWHNGRLVLVSFDNHQRMLNVPHVVASLEGTLPWRYYQNVFRVPREALEARVGLQLIGATGAFAARDLSLREVQERASYRWFWGLGLAAWLAGLAWMAYPFLSRLRFDWRNCLMYLAIAGIFAGTLMPASLKIELVSELDTTIDQVAPYEEYEGIAGRYLNLVPTDKLGHLLYFALLALAMLWVYPGMSRLQILSFLLILAAVSEVLQFFVEGRQPQFRDFLIDSIGPSLTIGSSGLLYLMRRRLSAPRPE